MERKIIQWLVSFFFFFETDFANSEFVICLPLMRINDNPSAFLDFESLYRRAYWLERSIFLKSLRQCCKRLCQRFSSSENFRREVIGEKKMKTKNFIRANRRS